MHVGICASLWGEERWLPGQVKQAGSAQRPFIVWIAGLHFPHLKNKAQNRATVSFKWDNMHASALRSAIKIQAILLPVQWGFQLGTMVNVVTRSGVKTPRMPCKARPSPLVLKAAERSHSHPGRMRQRLNLSFSASCGPRTLLPQPLPKDKVK